MEVKNSLLIVRRCLASLDILEDQGVAVNLIRADLSTVADRMEAALQAEQLERRQKALAVARETAFYINAADGDDSHDGRTPATAFKTIGAALNAIAAI